MTWMRSFTDLRLALATRLGVEEGDEDYWDSLPDDDPRAQVHDIYDWVGLPPGDAWSARCVAAADSAGRRRAPPTLERVLIIDQTTYDAIVAHAKRDHPDEACGIVAGPEGSDRPSGSSRWSTPRVARRSTSSTPPSCSRSTRRCGDNDEEPVVVYHSHTATEAYPSRTDIGLASEPNAHYVLVSTREHGNNEGPWSSGPTGSSTAR